MCKNNCVLIRSQASFSGQVAIVMLALQKVGRRLCEFFWQWAGETGGFCAVCQLLTSRTSRVTGVPL